MSVYLFSPVRQAPDVLLLSLQSHRGLAGIGWRFYVDDCTDERSSQLLREEGMRDGVTVFKAPDLEAATVANHQWNHAGFSRMAGLRNYGIAKVLDTNATAMFTVDSDVILHPQTVERLASLDKDIASTVYWSKWPGADWWLPQVWDTHPYNFDSADSILRLKYEGTWEVGGTGACSLVQRRVLVEGGCDYSPIYSLPSVGIWRGEDRAFCLRASARNFGLWVDTAFTAFHVYRPEQLAEAREWFDDGCHPGYFRRKWLTPMWEAQVRAMFR